MNLCNESCSSGWLAGQLASCLGVAKTLTLDIISRVPDQNGVSQA